MRPTENNKLISHIRMKINNVFLMTYDNSQLQF